MVETRSAASVELRVVDASDLFLGRLAGVTDPQEKRRLIGHTFIEVFRDEARSIPDARLPGPGDALPGRDRERGRARGPGGHIKIHHNVGGLPEELGFELIEPLRDLFKDEVRRLGWSSACPRAWSGGTRFPGPGWRCAAWARSPAPRLEVLRQADAICSTRSEASGLDRQDRPGLRRPAAGPVGGGDGRRPHLRERVAVRAVQTDGLHDRRLVAHALRAPGTISTRIINEVRGVNRVVYDISSKPPARSSGSETAISQLI